MTELWSDDKKDLEIKAKIISECAYLPEFFPEFPDKDLSIEELNKYMDDFFIIFWNFSRYDHPIFALIITLVIAGASSTRG